MIVEHAAGPVDVPAVTKHILDRMDARSAEIAKLLRAVQAALA